MNTNIYYRNQEQYFVEQITFFMNISLYYRTRVAISHKQQEFVAIPILPVEGKIICIANIARGKWKHVCKMLKGGIDGPTYNRVIKENSYCI